MEVDRELNLAVRDVATAIASLAHDVGTGKGDTTAAITIEVTLKRFAENIVRLAREEGKAPTAPTEGD